MSDTDEYKLAYGILGRHPDAFYGAIGRVVCVCAVLEDQVTALRHTLAGLGQGVRTHEPVDAQIKAARTHIAALAEQGQQLVGEFLDAATAAFRHRNELVHSSFPAQPDGRLWGHRPARNRALTDGRADTVETSLEELRAFIARLSALVGSFNEVHAAAGLRI